MPAHELPEEATVGAVARLLGVSDRRVRQMIAEGIAVPAGRGRLALGATIRGAVAASRQERGNEALNAARVRAAAAKAAALERENRRRDGEVIDLEDHDAILDRAAGLFLEGLASLPARIGGRDAGLRRKVEAATDALRADLARRLGELAERCTQEACRG